MGKQGVQVSQVLGMASVGNDSGFIVSDVCLMILKLFSYNANDLKAALDIENSCSG